MKRSTSDSAVWIALGAIAAARSIHWFITPMRHAHAGAGSHAATWFALAAGLAMIGYGFHTRRRERAGAFTD